MFLLPLQGSFKKGWSSLQFRFTSELVAHWLFHEGSWKEDLTLRIKERGSIWEGKLENEEEMHISRPSS